MKVIDFNEAKKETPVSVGESLTAIIKDRGLDTVTDAHFMLVVSSDSSLEIATSELKPAQSSFLLDMAKSVIIDSALSGGPDLGERE